jgi:fructokinase
VTTIAVVGEALIDLLIAPDRAMEARPGGGPYTTARTLARLGAETRFVGRLSTDPFGRRLTADLLADGVRLDRAVTTDDPTTLAVAELDAAGDATYRFYVDGTSAPGLVVGDLRAALDARVAAVHIGTLGLVMEPIGSAIEAVIGELPVDVLVMLDPNVRLAAIRDLPSVRARIDRLAQRADVIKVSDDDLQVLDGQSAAGSTIERWTTGRASVVLRTAGPWPVTIHGPTGMTTVGVPTVPVVDTVGAGDAFGGGFLAAVLGAGSGRAALGDPAAVHEAVQGAVAVAALTCTRPGADPPTAAEVAGVGRLVGDGPSGRAS